MNSSNNKPLLRWCWRRGIDSGKQILWTEMLQATPGLKWAMIERSGRSRLVLEAYVERREEAALLARRWGGQVRAINAMSRLKPESTPPIAIGKKFQVIHETPVSAKYPDILPNLHIPHGVAFGSGDHATTSMLLRALARHKLKGKSVLDLGTGSGVLALAARILDARKIVATDFDPDAIRTARQNEALNFPTQRIFWRRADVKRLHAITRYDFVLANLFSGILVEAAPQITGCVASGGSLWLSGILRSQEKEVTSAYLCQGLQLTRVAQRGKWIMLQWAAKPV